MPRRHDGVVHGSAHRTARPSGTVTENQRQILLRLFAGSVETQIAADTNRKPSTIPNTVRRVRKQLGARTDFDLIRHCLRLRIVTLEEIFTLAETLGGLQPPASAKADRG